MTVPPESAGHDERTPMDGPGPRDAEPRSRIDDVGPRDAEPRPSGGPVPGTAVELLAGFAHPAAECRPMMRWWWFGPDVDRADVVRQLSAMANAGLGGVEVSYVYPLSRVEHPFLSAEFLDDLRFAAETASSLGLRFDLTLGSGWSFGGPHVTSATASRRLVWDVREISAGQVRLNAVPRWPGEELVAAYVGDGSLQEPPRALERVAPVGTVVQVDAGHSPRLVALAWSSPTGQQVKRAAVGAEGPVLDHYSAAAVRDHLRAVADVLVDAVGADLIGSVFCDSLEAYEADWTPELPGAFLARCSRDPLEELWMLRFEAAGSDAFRRDYYETLSELFERNFLRVIREWAAERAIPFRVQNYGVPLTTLSAYRSVDVIEGEGWGWRGVTQTRWAASAAHRLGRDIVSAEAWTWVHSPSLRATPLDLKGEAHEHFLLGVNQLIGHGWPASPGRSIPGRLFYASGALDDRNAWWPAMPALARYLTRLCWLMRQGRPIAEVTLYLPSADAYDVLGPAQGGSLDLWRTARAIIGEAIPSAIRDAGFDFDLVDDGMVDELDPVAVAAVGPVVLPHVERLPDRTLAWLRAVSAAGGTVLDVPPGGAGTRSRQHELSAEPWRRVADGELGDALLASAVPDLRVEPACEEVGFVHRRVSAVDVYLVANTGARTRRLSVTPRDPRTSWQRWDASTGDVVAAGAGTAVPLELAPYEAAVIVLGDDLPETGIRQGSWPDPMTVSLGALAPWTVAFTDEAPVPVGLPHDWTAERPHFAGTAAYDVVFDSAGLWGAGVPARVELDFGVATPVRLGDAAEQGMRGASYRAMVEAPIREEAMVEVNGVACGTIYAPPYRVDVTHAVRAGENALRIVVGNASAAALASDEAMRTLESDVAASHRRYGTRFRMQDVEHAADGLRSGLLTVPALRWWTNAPATAG